MITGFGNNTVSALASDITATQTTFSVIPGAGDKFEQLLTTDNTNAGSPHGVYAKLTLTDSQGTVFEICHLIKVAGDSLTVIRGQEGTAAKGWALNDVVANFATRGSEESFVQIEQLQGGDFTSATAGGTPNALTISLPSTYLNNASSDWALKTPLMIMPIATNTGAVTIQVTLAGKVVGTFPAYKGNQAQLEKGDILAGVPFICALVREKTYFAVINPVNIYAGLLRANNLSDVADADTARKNINALSIDGGDVGYLNNASHFGTRSGMWEGAGAFQGQYTAPYAPFVTPGYIAPREVSQYHPLIKGVLQTKDYGYAAAFSFGALTSGNATFPSAIITVTTDGGTVASWSFNPVDRSFYSPGPVMAGGNINSDGDISGSYIASRGGVHAEGNITSVGDIISGSGAALYERGANGLARVYSPNNPQPLPHDLSIAGNISSNAGIYEQGQRVFSPNNPQPIDLSGYATTDWVYKNFINGYKIGPRVWIGSLSGVSDWTVQVPQGAVLIS